jgi:hypothetical protein
MPISLTYLTLSHHSRFLTPKSIYYYLLSLFIIYPNHLLLLKLPKDPFNPVLGIKYIDSKEERAVQQE